MYMRLISWKPNKTPPQALLHVPPAMTKHEITEYLTKIYDVDVTKVMTANFLGVHLFHFPCLKNVHWQRHQYSFILNLLPRQMEEVLRQEEDFIVQAKELQDGAGLLR